MVDTWQEELGRSRLMYKIQQTLFNAYQNPMLVTKALEYAAEEVGTEKAALIVLERQIITKTYSWPPIDGEIAEFLIGRNLMENQPEMIAGDFMMSIKNIESYQMIQQMGTMDFLTNIKNRNAYQQCLAKFEPMAGELVCCIYIDVNGLHELDNCQRHSAGDEMLICVPNQLQEIFGTEHAYRIGGDEFVVWCKNMREAVVVEKQRFYNQQGNDRRNR